jgi:NAD+ synthase (glutamine-hydrolysing)
LQDYVNKNHFNSVVLGLSGGIDSAVTAAIAVTALGKDRVKGVILPSRYTDTISIEDATMLANNLGIQSSIISIEPAYEALLNSLSDEFAGKPADVTEENLQARVRGNILMAISNKEKSLLLTTGNRSELAVGYCTLYGDMAGGFAVLKDVPKTMVYHLANYCNRSRSLIPQRTIIRPPTAELAPDQLDQDTLPPYDVLDGILELYINQSKSIPEICAEGYDKTIVERIIAMIHRNEYKRSQAAIGTHIYHKTFGIDWRYPLTNAFKG